MTAFAIAAALIIVSAFTRLNAVVLGRPVSIPYIGIAAAIVVLALAVLLALLVRAVIADRPVRWPATT